MTAGSLSGKPGCFLGALEGPPQCKVDGHIDLDENKFLMWRGIVIKAVNRKNWITVSTAMAA